MQNCARKHLTPCYARRRVGSVAQVKGDVDTDWSLRRAAKSQPGKPIKVRLQPQLETIDLKYRRFPCYLAWRGVHWVVECQTVDEARALRDAMIVFFDVVGETREMSELVQAIDKVKSFTVESPAVHEVQPVQ